MVARVLGVMGLVSVGFLLFTLLTSNPFERLLPAPPDGRDLNPLLQDPGMVIHPPMLYMGYVGFSVAFAFAVAALLAGKLDAAWARWSRPWTTGRLVLPDHGHRAGQLVGLLRAGLGRLVVLGPGGERLLHALAGGHGADPLAGGGREARRLQGLDGAAGDHAAFSLSLLGTFLVRSGVLTRCTPSPPTRRAAVHPGLPGGGGRRLAHAVRLARAAASASAGASTASRANRCCWATTCCWWPPCGAVMLGTLYPLALDALGLGKISVGPPYFDTVFVPLMAPVVLLMGVGPLARWKQARCPTWRAAALGLGWPAWWRRWRCRLAAGRSALVALGLLLAAWVFTSTAVLCCSVRAPNGCARSCCAVAQLLGHGGGAPGRGRVHRRRDHGRATRPSAT
jgi:cytochrome c-type biogenesis protein CcmF